MPDNCLTVEVVERIQLAIQKERSVSGFVNKLTSATLAGLVEYGCLRHIFQHCTPSLPSAILSGVLGQASLNVRSEIGTRSAGAPTVPIRDLQPPPIQFITVGTEEELEGLDWNTYCYHFTRSAKGVGFSETTAESLGLALHEIASNAVIHSQSSVPAFLGYQVSNRMVEFCVADVGIGVLQSLRTSPKHHDLLDSNDAIRRALKPGVSRFEYGGTGFNSVFKAITAEWGVVRFRSGNGCVSMDGTDLDYESDKIKISFPPSLPGFQASVTCKLPP